MAEKPFAAEPAAGGCSAEVVEPTGEVLSGGVSGEDGGPEPEPLQPKASTATTWMERMVWFIVTNPRCLWKPARQGIGVGFSKTHLSPLGKGGIRDSIEESVADDVGGLLMSFGDQPLHPFDEIVPHGAVVLGRIKLDDPLCFRRDGLVNAGLCVEENRHR